VLQALLFSTSIIINTATASSPGGGVTSLLQQQIADYGKRFMDVVKCITGYESALHEVHVGLHYTHNSDVIFIIL
jgi:hypothetical protein